MKGSSRVIASVVTATMLATSANLTVFASSSSSDGQIREKIINISGETRYETAVEVSKEWGECDTVVLVNGENIVDALPASPYAYKIDSPILYTETDRLTPVTRNQIKKLKAKEVVVVGGSGVISENVVNTLKGMKLSVKRIEGKDRVETAAEIAKQMGNFDDVAIVNGMTGMADALSIAAPAAQNGMPILLTNASGDSLGSGKEIADEAKIQYIVGGDGVVKYSLEDSLDNADRLEGINRNETNGEVLQEFYSNGQFENLYISKDGSKKASELVDALTVAPLAAKNESPLMIINNSISAKQEAFLKNVTADKITTVGGGVSKVNVLRIFKTLEENRIVSNLKPIFPDLDDAEAPTIESVKYGGEKNNKIFVNYNQMMSTSGRGSVKDKSLYEINVNGQGYKSISKISGATIKDSIGNRNVTITLPKSVLETNTGSKEKTNSDLVKIRIGKVKNIKGKVLDTSALDKDIKAEFDGKVSLNSREPEVIDSRKIDIYLDGEFIGVNKVDLSKVYLDIDKDNISTNGLGISNRPEILTAYTRGVSSDVCKVTVIFKNKVFEDDGTSSVLKNIEFKEGAIKTKLGTPCESFKIAIEKGSSTGGGNTGIGTIETTQIPFVDGKEESAASEYTTKLKTLLAKLSGIEALSKFENLLSINGEPIDINFGENNKFKDYKINVDNEIPKFIKSGIEIKGKLLNEDGTPKVTFSVEELQLLMKASKVNPVDYPKVFTEKELQILTVANAKYEGLTKTLEPMFAAINNPIIPTFDESGKVINLTVVSPIYSMNGKLDMNGIMATLAPMLKPGVGLNDDGTINYNKIIGALETMLNVIGPKNFEKAIGNDVKVAYNNGYKEPANLAVFINDVYTDDVKKIVEKLEKLLPELMGSGSIADKISTIKSNLSIKEMYTILETAKKLPQSLLCTGETNKVAAEVTAATKAEGGIKFTSGTIFEKHIVVVVNLNGKEEEIKITIPSKATSLRVADTVRNVLSKNDGKWTEKYEVKPGKDNNVILQAKKAGKTGDTLKITLK